MCYYGEVKEVARLLASFTLILSLIYTIYEKKYYSDSFFVFSPVIFLAG